MCVLGRVLSSPATHLLIGVDEILLNTSPSFDPGNRTSKTWRPDLDDPEGLGQGLDGAKTRRRKERGACKMRESSRCATAVWRLGGQSRWHTYLSGRNFLFSLDAPSPFSPPNAESVRRRRPRLPVWAGLHGTGFLGLQPRPLPCSSQDRLFLTFLKRALSRDLKIAGHSPLRDLRTRGLISEALQGGEHILLHSIKR